MEIRFELWRIGPCFIPWSREFMSRTEQPSPPDDELPAEIRRALKGLDGPGIQIPRELDRAILADAKAAFFRRRRFWLVTRWSGAAVAAAAVVMIALHIFAPGTASNRGAVASNHRLTLSEVADINHDGRVDILDAYILARKISHHELLDPAWDINGDGVIDQKDVDLIAGIAVQAAEPEPAR
jgi:hypothetical protein